MTLATALEKLALGDAAFAKRCGLHRTQIWAYRTVRFAPDSENAAAILAALKRAGVEMTLAELLKPALDKRKRALRAA